MSTSELPTTAIDPAAVAARLETMFQRSVEPMIVGDGAHILDANESMCAVLGMDRAVIQTMHFTDILVGGDEEAERLGRVRRENGFVAGETNVLRGDGIHVPVRFWSVVLPVAAGGVRAFSGILPTDRFPDHHETNALLRDLFDDSPDGKLVVDNGGHTIYANQRHLDLWRLTREDMALPFEGRWPKTAANLANPVQFVEMQRAVREGESGQPFEIETVDGRVIEVRSVALHGDGTRESARSYTTRDITAQRRAERDLRESETRYRTLVSSLPVGVVMQYADGRIGECNAAAERILGLSRGQLLGLSSFDARWHCVDEDGAPIAPDEHPAVVTLRTGEPCHNVVMGVYHVSGTLRWLLVNSEPIASPDGGVEAAVVSFQDVTEQRLGQSALIQSRTAEAFNALASGVAHKINNSLTSIVGNAYLAGLPAGVPDEMLDLLAQIISAASDATALVRDLQALSRRERMGLRSVDVSDSTRGVLALLPPEDRDRVTASLEGDLPPVLFDPSALEQAVSGLLRNALEAGANVAIDTFVEHRATVRPERECTPRVVPPGRYLCIQVRDDGPGVHPDVAGRIFDPFVTTKFMGRGLGLAATAGIAATHHSFAEVHSSPGGCVATLLIPLA